MTNSREYFINEPEGSVDAAVIWLHGLGADGRDFAGLVDELGLPLQHGVRFIFPNAPYANITINNGMSMRAWYDIYDLSSSAKEDVTGIEKSQQLIGELIQEQIDQGISSHRIILGGFSQGGAISLYTALRYPHKLGGIICLSAYLPLIKLLDVEIIANNIATPIFIAHGMFDPVVPYNFGQVTRDVLLQNNCSVEWHSYPMEHTICLEEIAEISSFIKRCLGYA